MRVLVDTTYARRGHTGTSTYLARLLPALRALGVDVREAANEARLPPAGGGAGSLRNAAADRWWTAVELPRRARAERVDVLHHPLPARSAAAPCAQAITLHDLAFERLPEAFDPRFRAFARRVHRHAARRADAVVCVSQTTAVDAAALWGVRRARIVVARHGPGQEPDVLAAAATGAGGHFLYVGDAEPRKNVGLLLAAYADYRRAEGPAALPLVLAGSGDARNGNGEQPGVRHEHVPGESRLAELLAGAAALVHPSLHEGFGLTPLEAMSAGTPVLAARSPGVVEICADAAAWFDPRDAGSLAAGLSRLAGDDAVRRDLAERGRRRAAEFSWARAARAHVDAYTVAVENTR
ncbi:MAG TPA: glycosyltransferase family 1 protein [Solirubrobacteraceae bacterium]